MTELGYYVCAVFALGMALGALAVAASFGEGWLAGRRAARIEARRGDAQLRAAIAAIGARAVAPARPVPGPPR